MMRVDEMGSSRQFPLFANTSESQLEELLNGAFLQRFPAHVELIREGEPADFLYIVVEGQVEIFGCYRQRETTIAVVGPGVSFILAAVIMDKPYLKSARTIMPSRLLMVPSATVRKMFDQDANFARSLTQDLAKAYRGVVQELKNQKLRSSLERLAAWILRYNVKTDSSGSFELPFDKKILASRLGMAPEVLSRAFLTLQAYGIKVNGRRIVIDDLASLTKLAVPDHLIDDPAV